MAASSILVSSEPREFYADDLPILAASFTTNLTQRDVE
ncbi:hypothetical protein JCM19240_1057 [Vibrio maritimus]|uniref:Uncharacterized protein n=1 Tax=Vibrio maritimus TaxID=990268 RepID=A0A090T5X1_9VIBR|nr:hypothetical protein JCM19240_1057 [Vibrio maritimus]